MKLETLSEIISGYAEEVAKEISEMKMYDVSRATNVLSLRIKWILTSVQDSITNKAEQHYQRLKAEVNRTDNTSWQTDKFRLELTAAKAAAKEANRVQHIFERATQYEALKLFVKEKFGENALNEFTENSDRYIAQVNRRNKSAQQNAESLIERTKY